MSSPVGGFDPQPCCDGGGGEGSEVTIVGPDPLNVNVTNQISDPLDVNVIGPDPLNVNVTNQLTEPLDVNVLNQLAEPFDVTLVGPDPVNVNVTNQLTEPFDVNVLNQLAEPFDVTLVGPDPVNVNVTNQLTEPFDVNVLSTVPVSVTLGGSTAASATLTAATTGNGLTVDFASARSNVTLFVQPNGAVTAGVVALQGSHDGVNWTRIASSAMLATGVNQFVSSAGGAFRWYRGVVTENVVGGGTVTATLMFA